MASTPNPLLLRTGCQCRHRPGPPQNSTLGGMKRVLALVAAILFGLTTWFGLVRLLRLTWQWHPLLGDLAVWLSHWTIVGWAFGIVLMVAWYKLLMRVFRRKPPQVLAPTDGETNAT